LPDGELIALSSDLTQPLLNADHETPEASRADERKQLILPI